MHELSITTNIVAIALEFAGGKPIRRVKIQIGALSSIVPESVRFCFDVCAKDTLAEGASLDIDIVEGLGLCKDCGCEVPMKELYTRCECGSHRVTCLAGMELKVKELEVDENV